MHEALYPQERSPDYLAAQQHASLLNYQLLTFREQNSRGLVNLYRISAGLTPCHFPAVTVRRVIGERRCFSTSSKPSAPLVACCPPRTLRRTSHLQAQPQASGIHFVSEDYCDLTLHSCNLTAVSCPLSCWYLSPFAVVPERPSPLAPCRFSPFRCS
jgi:hypothetical protein